MYWIHGPFWGLPAFLGAGLMMVQSAAGQLLALTVDAQLLVLGRSARGPRLVERVGSPLWSLLNGAGCPVLVVPT